MGQRAKSKWTQTYLREVRRAVAGAEVEQPRELGADRRGNVGGRVRLKDARDDVVRTRDRVADAGGAERRLLVLLLLVLHGECER